ncbi:MAG: hypothetical protein AAF556_08830 [Pseudomonadota bacterium]
MTSVIDDTVKTGMASCGGCPCPTEQDLGVPAVAAVSDAESATG